MTAKRHIECSVPVDRRLDRCNRERISDRSRLGFEGGSQLLENKTLAARDKSTSKCIFRLMQNTSLCQLAGTCSFAHRWCGITLSLAAGDPRPAGRQVQSRRLQRQKFGQRVWY